MRTNPDRTTSHL